MVMPACLAATYLTIYLGLPHSPPTARPATPLQQQSQLTSRPPGLPWYFANGTVVGGAAGRGGLWPEEVPGGDRIIEQLEWGAGAGEVRPMKRVLVWSGLGSWGRLKSGAAEFAGCPVRECEITTERAAVASADLVVFRDHLAQQPRTRPPHQAWLLYMLECPHHTASLAGRQHSLNWTATYRQDSTIVTPYERWQYYDSAVTSRPQHRNYAANKTKQVSLMLASGHYQVYNKDLLRLAPLNTSS